MNTNEQITEYIKGALQLPLKSKVQLLQMVVLHFNIRGGDAGLMIREVLQKEGPSYGYKYSSLPETTDGQ